MTFTEIKYFVEVYQQKSISRASENLYVVPSVISEAIKRLEREFNTNLFTRRANKIIPTAAGEQFYFDALEILNASLNLKKNMLQFSSERSFESICKISLPDSLIHTYSDALFDSLSKRFPNVDFVIETFFINTDLAPDDNRDILLLNVNDSSISKTIETLLNNNQYKIKSIAVTEVYIWCSKNSPIVSLNDISIKDILNSDYKLLALSDRTNTLTGLETVQNKYVPCVTTVKSFLHYLRSGDRYVLDFPSPQGKCSYEDVLGNDKNFIRKKLTDANQYVLAYKKEFEDVIPFVSDILLNL